MPKITLTNNETGKIEEFDPVDAREILTAKDTVYSVPQDARDGIGARVDPASLDINVPQVQTDPEMQTGLSIEKYARQAVVKAQIGMPRALTTLGEPIVPEEVDAGTMTKVQLQEALSQRGVAFHSAANKAELQALYDKR